MTLLDGVFASTSASSPDARRAKTPSSGASVGGEPQRAARSVLALVEADVIGASSDDPAWVGMPGLRARPPFGFSSPSASTSAWTDHLVQTVAEQRAEIVRLRGRVSKQRKRAELWRLRALRRAAA